MMREQENFRDVYEVLSKEYPQILSKEDIARLLGISVSTAKRKFKGKVTLPTFIKENLL